MREITFIGSCIATYEGYIQVPDDVKNDELVDYINEHSEDIEYDDFEIHEDHGVSVIELDDETIIVEDIA